ncbi:hypothetical protein [Dyadobacter psychrotolerans]|uniref:Uncharacterized protein n=1 Tax=Dyadobacter psychrotolerans TaxID=2541721 RepID=A0A4R5DWU1_9BACT|nr:hypothetical protein [Dyadobacter psychrotolerans]TDE17104.1 hypothetical protein E0F88_04165 [Dyadobacter psychrotolerans]
MKEKYETMLTALSAAVANLDHVFTATEVSTTINLSVNPERNINILNQTMALRDCILRLRELFWLLGAPALNLDVPKKINLKNAYEVLLKNNFAHIKQLELWGYGIIKTYFFTPYITEIKITELLDEISGLSDLLSEDYTV